MLMYPSEARQKILDSQRGIIERLDALEGLASAPCPVTEEKLRVESAALVPALLAHIHLDDTILVPVLADTDAWRALRVRRLEAHHDSQRASIIQLIEQLSSSDANTEQLCAVVRDIVAALRADFAEEASLMLSPEVLRDDLVNVAAGA
ncbi:MAG: hypothetical protein ACI8S6_005774 [Myxococcota bacterium]|jgi:hypothetical protein